MSFVYFASLLAFDVAQNPIVSPPVANLSIVNENYLSDLIVLGEGRQDYCDLLKLPKTISYSPEEAKKVKYLKGMYKFSAVNGLSTTYELKKLIDSFETNLQMPENGGYRPEGHKNLVFVPISTKFSGESVYDLNVAVMKQLLGDHFDYTCDASKYRPIPRDLKLMAYPEVSCHTICRTCFSGSLPICLRRNLDNNFGKTCFCTFDAAMPIENPVFRITDQ